MILDRQQKYLESKFNKIASNINVIHRKGIIQKIVNKILSYFVIKKNKKKLQDLHGIYFFGGVGRGKTMLMQKFYDYLEVPKKFIHYQQFMQELHKKMHNLRGKKPNKLVNSLVVEIADKYKVICMDEFEIKDITDAMIVMRLFQLLKKSLVFVFVTTNIKPDDLYKDGLQRDAFLPFIESIKKDFEVIHLDTEKDYRYAVLKDLSDRILFPKNRENSQKFVDLQAKIYDKEELYEVNLEIFGRKLPFKRAHNTILVSDFAELFDRDLGYSDYVEISKKFSIIVVSNVRPISEYENNIATRFINFIDNAYFNRVLLFMEIICDINEIYLKGSKKDEFVRVVSRLNEMNSASYIKNKE